MDTVHDCGYLFIFSYVPYCSSDAWSGTYRATTDGDFSFMGSLILEEVVKDLLNMHDLTKAKQVYLAGSRSVWG